LLASLLLANSAVPAGETLYKYRGPDGEWIFSDRPPGDDQEVETRDMASGRENPEVRVSHRLVDGSLQLTGSNGYHVPVELVLGIDSMANAVPPGPEQPLRFVVPAKGEMDLFALLPSEEGLQPELRYRYTWVTGDPLSVHRPEQPYRVPFAVAAAFPVSQAFPQAITHGTPDSRYAVDISMPVGTGIYAARGGTVFEVTGTNFRGGLDPEDAAAANLVHILHDDGTYAVYAHLNWDSIRVRPGDVVSRGEYIADSGNTGFTSGPHLHFAVLRNRGMGVESVPVAFEGANGSEVTPETGVELVAY
jgi:murein DD-endopeptidase MepM/ murein hydrolase activator NlpD